VHVIATAGHVDHGKSTLVRALTGTDPDRLDEEKRRGLTIDLGFASTTLPSGAVIAFVDVPGHVRFLRNMVAGIGAVEACLFVVDATEGWKPQSAEHLAILEMFGLERGVVALTKRDIADEDRRERSRAEIDEALHGTFLAGADVIECDGISGHGLGLLRNALTTLTQSAPSPPDRDRPRLWVDRSFAARGAGTVVTGTLTLGSVATGDELMAVPGQRRVRVRALQSLHTAQAMVGPGSRVALNLLDVRHDQIGRGTALVRPGQWHLTDTVDASLRVLDSVDHPVSRRGSFLCYLGTGEHAVQLRVLSSEQVAPGGTGAVRLHLPTALPLLPGDRYLLRDSGRSETLGGGEVLDVDPVLPAARARPDRSIDRVVAERGWVDSGELERLTGEAIPARVGRWVVSEAARASAEHAAREAVRDAGPLGLDLATLDERQRAVLATLAEVTVAAGRATFDRADDDLARHPYLEELRRRPFAPPPPSAVGADELRELQRRGLVVGENGVYFAAEAVEQAAEIIAERLEDQPEGMTVAEVREALQTSRKYAMPLLARLDATGRTRRRGDVRIAGPRLRDRGVR
jgi:selenocysteine-specific elongation factor